MQISYNGQATQLIASDFYILSLVSFSPDWTYHDRNCGHDLIYHNHMHSFTHHSFIPTSALCCATLLLCLLCCCCGVSLCSAELLLGLCNKSWQKIIYGKMLNKHLTIAHIIDIT